MYKCWLSGGEALQIAESCAGRALSASADAPALPLRHLCFGLRTSVADFMDIIMSPEDVLSPPEVELLSFIDRYALSLVVIMTNVWL